MHVEVYAASRKPNRTGTPIAVTCTVLTPTKPWIGFGQRPVVWYAVGTQGLGDQCAPSRQLAAGSEYEGAFISGLVAPLVRPGRESTARDRDRAETGGRCR